MKLSSFLRQREVLFTFSLMLPNIIFSQVTVSKKPFRNCYDGQTVWVYDDATLKLDYWHNLQEGTIYTDNTPFKPYLWTSPVWVKAKTFISFTPGDCPSSPKKAEGAY